MPASPTVVKSFQMLSILIVNYRTWDSIERNLAGLYTACGRARHEPLPWEIVVADNHSEDGLLAAFQKKFPAVRVLLSEGNFGYAHGCNQAARAAQGEWLLFMNPDVEATPEDIERLWRYQQAHPEWRILSAPQSNGRGQWQRAFGSFTGWATYFPLGRALLRGLRPERYPDPRQAPEHFPEVFPVDWVAGSLVLMTKADWRTLGGWDEDYWMYCEDEDLCRCARKSGWRVGFYSGASFKHVHAASSRLNEAITIATKSEAIFSKHLYLLKHEPNRGGRSLRAWIRTASCAKNIFFTALDAGTFRRVRALRLRHGIYSRLARLFKNGSGGEVAVSDRSRSFAEKSTGQPRRNWAG